MIWTLLFSISVAQGIFLISLIVIKGAGNPLASRLIIAMLAIMVLTNFGYLVIRTDLVRYVPQFFAVPFGMLLLLGPLFYLYTRSVIDPSFIWKKKYLLHFIPYAIQLLMNLPFLLVGPGPWNELIQSILSGHQPVRIQEKVALAIQNIHLFIYIVITVQWMMKPGRYTDITPFIIPLSSRIKWLRQLAACFSLFALTVTVLYLYILFHGVYQPVTNYAYTLVSSGIIYFVAYKLVLAPSLISPDFVQKYKTYRPVAGGDGEHYIGLLKVLMEEKKIFTSMELKLPVLAEKVGLPAHQLSRLINEKFGKTFTDYINELRVHEFIRRLRHAQYQGYSIYGIALDVGFNSKSSFNTAFKKITGKTPSEYKKTGTVL